MKPCQHYGKFEAECTTNGDLWFKGERVYLLGCNGCDYSGKEYECQRCGTRSTISQSCICLMPELETE